MIKSRQLPDEPKRIYLFVVLAGWKAEEFGTKLFGPWLVGGQVYRPSSAMRPRIDCVLTALSPRVGKG